MLVLAAATCGPAAASTVSVERDASGRTTLVYRGTPGPDSAVIDSYRDRFIVTDEAVAPGPGCEKRPSGAVCGNASEVVRVVASAGDGDDYLWLSTGLRDRIDGGPGDDTIGRSPYASFEPGRLHGGAGDDFVSGGGGDDTVAGGSGDDVLDGGAERDALSGGPGVDLVVYAERRGHVEVSLDGRGRDGAPGSRDDIAADVEGVVAESTSTLVGNGGANLLEGSRYEDRLTGRGGLDTFDGNGGDDVIDARDGRMDLVGCGGGIDTAYVDRVDDVSSECERVRFTRAPPGR
jgi:Ca2+-binding RTX toxin-like protein